VTNQRLNAPQDETTDPEPGGHGWGCIAPVQLFLGMGGERLGWVLSPVEVSPDQGAQTEAVVSFLQPADDPPEGEVVEVASRRHWSR
jgi:hypothetical protein